jgi:MarR family transcriptional regulator, 2-MHQ and catechol-resistance regulon repressor
MKKTPSDPVHCWLVWRKAHEAASDHLSGGIEETDISDTDFRVLEALLHKGPLPVNTIGPKVHLTPGSIDISCHCHLALTSVLRHSGNLERYCAMSF